MYVCVCVLEMTYASNCSRAAALQHTQGTPISKCQQLGRLATRGNYWKEDLSSVVRGDDLLETTYAEKDLGVLVYNRLSMSQWCTL